MNSYDEVDFNDQRLKIERKPITEIEIQLAKTQNGGFTRETLREWGVPWPPISGWRRAIVSYGVPLIDMSGASKKAKKAANKKAIALLAEVSRTPPKRPTKAKKSLVSKELIRDFYASWEWRTARMETLKRFGARCMCCGATPQHEARAGQPVKIVVDHIKPISRYWGLKLDPENLQVLCDECNQGKGNWDETDYRPSR
ncbi:HNH endonuclease [Agrobacterium salinitolerans]